MRFDVITLFPQMVRGLADYGITGRAITSELVQLEVWNPRDYSVNKQRRVDDRPYGGGPGMVLAVQPLRDTLSAICKHTGTRQRVICLSPQGRRLDQQGVLELLANTGIVFIAGRYEAIDERFVHNYVDEEWSIGDYVLSGGELAAMVMIDAITRLIPDVLGNNESSSQDSFANGLLDCPHYTRPANLDGLNVPDVLLSGDHPAIDKWRQKQALGRTWQRRPDLLTKLALTATQRSLLDEFIEEQGG